MDSIDTPERCDVLNTGGRNRGDKGYRSRDYTVDESAV